MFSDVGAGVMGLTLDFKRDLFKRRAAYNRLTTEKNSHLRAPSPSSSPSTPMTPGEQEGKKRQIATTSKRSFCDVQRDHELLLKLGKFLRRDLCDFDLVI